MKDALARLGVEMGNGIETHVEIIFRMGRIPAMAIGEARAAIIDPREFAGHVIQRFAADGVAVGRKIECPAAKDGGALLAGRSIGIGEERCHRIFHHIGKDLVALFPSIHHMEDIVRIGLEPADLVDAGDRGPSTPTNAPASGSQAMGDWPCIARSRLTVSGSTGNSTWRFVTMKSWTMLANGASKLIEPRHLARLVHDAEGHGFGRAESSPAI